MYMWTFIITTECRSRVLIQNGHFMIPHRPWFVYLLAWRYLEHLRIPRHWPLNFQLISTTKKIAEV